MRLMGRRGLEALANTGLVGRLRTQSLGLSVMSVFSNELSRLNRSRVTLPSLSGLRSRFNESLFVELHGDNGPIRGFPEKKLSTFLLLGLGVGGLGL